MKLLVTGGAGFIGSNFIHYWLDKYPQDQIVNLDKLTYAGNLENLSSVENFPNYQFMKGDITDSSLVNKLFDQQNFDIVVHFAAESHVDRSLLEPGAFIVTNVLGTQVLLEAAVKHQVRFHHVSTDEVFGAIEASEERKFSEQTSYGPRSPYSASKAASDHLVRAYHHSFGLPVTISNCSNNYGPYQFPEKLFSLAITNLLEGKQIPVYGDGQQVRDWLYVEDHCRAIDLIINKGIVGETYCVGGLDQDVTNLEVVTKICHLLGKDPKTSLSFVKDRPGHDFKYAVDWSKIKNELGWQPSVTFEEGLKKTVDWYMENEFWWKKVKDGSYQEYYQKQYSEPESVSPQVATA